MSEERDGLEDLGRTPNTETLEKARRAARFQASALGLTREEADDVAQATSLELFLHWAKVRAPIGWARVVARRVALRAVRQRSHPIETDVERAEFHEWCPERHLDVVSAFSGLPDQSCAIWWTRNVERAAWDEVATVHGTSCSTAKRRSSRITKTLRQRISLAD